MKQFPSYLFSLCAGLLLLMPALLTQANMPTEASPSPVISIDQNWLMANYASYKKQDPVLTHVVKALTDKADLALTHKPYSVMSKEVTPKSGDKHDYMSIGPYWWPDKSKADGLPWVKRDGEVNPLSKVGGTDKPDMNRMLMDISQLSMAYFYTKDEKYAKHATLLINTWFIDPKTRMNPNLKFGQAIPGLFDGRKYGIIETRWYMRLIDDLALLSGSAAFTEEHNAQMKLWFNQYLDWLLTAQIGIDECDAKNNHGTYCEAQVAIFALYLGKKDLAKTYIQRAITPRLEHQFTANGSQPHELSRTKPLHYSVFNLEAYLFLARAGDHVGIDLWHYKAPNGASLKAAIDFLLPAITNEGYWKENKVHKKTRVGRLYYFLQYAHTKYGDEKYAQAMQDLLPVVANEDRSELSQCFLIMPKLASFTVENFKSLDPTGERSKYRCYY